MFRPWDEHLILSCLLVIMIFTHAIVAQDNQIPIEKFVSMLPIGQTEISAESIMSFILENPQILNKALKSQLVEKSRFLSDLNLEFKTFKANGTDSLLGLGIGYNYQRDLVMTTIKEKTARQTGLSLAFQTHGNVAFDKDTNPNDFLDADLSFSLYNSWGGAFTTSDIIRDKLADIFQKHKEKEILLIAHSMGTIVAYEVLIDVEDEVNIDSLITIGSPLGVPFIFEKLKNDKSIVHGEESKLRTPENILTEWKNLADLDDKIARSADMSKLFKRNSHNIAPVMDVVENDYESEGIENPHKSFGYLRTPELAQIIDDFLCRGKNKLMVWFIKKFNKLKDKLPKIK